MGVVFYMKVKELFEPYLKYYAIIGGRLNTGNTPKTLSEKKRFLYGAINLAVGEKDVTEIDEYDFARVAEVGNRYGTFGAQRSFLYFKQLMRFARRKYDITIDLNDMRIPHVPDKDIEYLTSEEMDKIRNCFDINSGIAGLRTRALIEFIMGTALRITECCSLNKNDINWETGEFGFYNCKTLEYQKTVCPPSSLAWLKLYIDKRKDDCEALFVSGRGRLLPVTSRNFINKSVKHLNINKTIAHHIFRKTCGTMLLQETDVKAVQEFLRHKDPETTLKFYTAVTKNQTREATSRITDKFVRPAIA